MRWRALLFTVAASLGVVASGCRKTTEIVVKLETPGVNPDEVTVRLHRSYTYDVLPDNTPKFVVAELVPDGDLNLIVTPQGSETVLSLLPPEDGSTYDLTMTVTSDPGYSVDPASSQPVKWIDNKALLVRFVISNGSDVTADGGDTTTTDDLAVAASPDLTQ